MYRRLAAVLSLLSFFGVPSHAALHDRGNGMIYSDVMNVTWLADANYAKTSGYDSDGLMTWGAALAWADQLVYGGFSDWRLPIGSPCGDPQSLVKCSQAGGEYSRLWYGELQSKYVFPVSIDLNTTHDDGLFVNVQSYNIYWSGTEVIPGRALGFHYLGVEEPYFEADARYAWAVRTGDVAAVPEPTGWALMLAGLTILGVAGARLRP